MGTKTFTQVIEQETDAKFLGKLAHTSLRQHCERACAMSYYKYGAVDTYVADHSLGYMQAAMTAYDKDKNAEHIVDIVNYAMFRQMFYPNEKLRMQSIALEYDSQYNEANYHPTDSSKSTKPISVREMMYSRLAFDGRAPRDFLY